MTTPTNPTPAAGIAAQVLKDLEAQAQRDEAARKAALPGGPFPDGVRVRATDDLAGLIAAEPSDAELDEAARELGPAIDKAAAAAAAALDELGPEGLERILDELRNQSATRVSGQRELDASDPDLFEWSSTSTTINTVAHPPAGDGWRLHTTHVAEYQAKLALVCVWRRRKAAVR